MLAATLKGIRREKGDEPHKAALLLPGMLRRIFRELTGNSWKAAVLCSFMGMLRKSQVTLSEAVLRRRDFDFYDWGLILII